MTNSKDSINPSHYQQGPIQCIEAIESATIGKSGIEAVCVANIIRYLWRFELKGGLEDVKKAQWYLSHLVAHLEEREEPEEEDPRSMGWIGDDGRP